MTYIPVKHLTQVGFDNTIGLTVGQFIGHRTLPMVAVAPYGLDGLDLAFGGDDDRYHIVNLTTDKGYFDSIAVCGAYNAQHALACADDYCRLMGVNAKAELLGGFDSVWDGLTLQKFVNDNSQNVDYKPVVTARRLNLAKEKITATPALWDGLTLKSHNGDVGQLLYELVRYDGLNELITPADQQSLIAILGDIEKVGFDALVETNAKLETLKNKLAKALEQASDNELSVTEVIQSKPFTKQGKANVYFEFGLSDGQTFRIFFHNPDSTPNKLTGQDIMVSWKWTLNSKDITVAVAPNQSESETLPMLAQRMMRIAKQNSKRYQSAQARKSKNEQKLNELTKSIDERTTYHTQVLADIDALREQIKTATQAIDDKAKGASKNTAENINESGLPITVANEPTDDEPAVAPNKPIQATSKSDDTKQNEPDPVLNNELFSPEFIHLLGKNYHSDDGASNDEILDNDFLEDLPEHEQKLLLGKTFAFGRALIAIANIAKKNGWKVVFGDFSHSINQGLFDGIVTKGYHITAQLMNDDDSIVRLAINQQGEIIAYVKVTGDTLSQNKKVKHTQEKALSNLIEKAFAGSKTEQHQSETPPQAKETTGQAVTTDEDAPLKQELEYRPHGKDLTFVGQEFDHTPTGDNYTVWGVEKGQERWGVAIAVETVNMGKKITTKELAQKVADVMAERFGYTQLEIRSDKEFLGGGVSSIQQAFGAGALSQNEQENTMNKPQNQSYTQSDIDYLQSIINKTIDLETVDMDKMIEIGEKDESDPMYEQALQIVSDYLDEMSQ